MVEVRIARRTAALPLIATDDQRIEAFSRLDTERWTYRTYQDGLNTSVALPALDICLLPSEVYEGIDLDRTTARGPDRGRHLAPRRGTDDRRRTAMPDFTTRPEILGTFGVVASTHWLATATGMAILERGGNAFDAAAAAGFALQVVEPHLNGPGGDLPIILYSAGKDAVEVICGQGVAPQAATVAVYRELGLDLVPGTGLLAAVVPGAFDAWLRMLRGPRHAATARRARTGDRLRAPRLPLVPMISAIRCAPPGHGRWRGLRAAVCLRGRAPWLAGGVLRDSCGQVPLAVAPGRATSAPSARDRRGTAGRPP